MPASLGDGNKIGGPLCKDARVKSPLAVGNRKKVGLTSKSNSYHSFPPSLLHNSRSCAVRILDEHLQTRVVLTVLTILLVISKREKLSQWERLYRHEQSVVSLKQL